MKYKLEIVVLDHGFNLIYIIIVKRNMIVFKIYKIFLLEFLEKMIFMDFEFLK